MTYGIDDELLFGRYAGATVREVVKANPGYIKWAISNIPDFDLDDEASHLFHQVCSGVRGID